MLKVSDKVQFTPQYQRLLFQKGYEHALGWWKVVDLFDDKVKLEPEGHRKCMSYLLVPNTNKILTMT